MAAIVAVHVAVIGWLVSFHGVVPPLTTLMVQMIAPTPPAPAVIAPRPLAVERKPVVRPQQTPQAPAPVLAVPSETPSAAADVTPVRPAPTSAPAPAPAAMATVSQPRFDANYLLNPAPAYPALSRRLGEEGKVVLRVFVEPDGRPSQIEIKTSSDSPRLDQAALDAVRRWKFVPARRGEDALGAWVLVPLIFNLQR